VAERGWTEYRAGRLESASNLFTLAMRSCPSHDGARIGMGYVTLRNNDIESASRWFQLVASHDTTNVDALVGSGLVAFRLGNGREAASFFERVLSREPNHATALAYLEQTRTALGVRPPRPPLVVPDSTVVAFRTHNDHFEVRRNAGWDEIYIKGVNIGAALPGQSPADFPDSATYADWIGKIGAMGANAVRLYTIHPPQFYQELLTYNIAHPEAPIYLIHGVWASPPPLGQYDDRVWISTFQSEIRSVVDVVHGRASLGPGPYRHYTADVSRWTAAFIIGREWEPLTVHQYNAQRPGRSNWSGRFITVRDGSATEAWMGRALEYTVSYEMEAYNEQRPIAFVNWPPLDPLRHVSEATNAEEVAILRSLGGNGALDLHSHNDDEETLDAARFRATPEFEAGHFAAFHVYPYYPDFLSLDPAYRDSRSHEGPSPYFGYLRALKDHLPTIPILIAEYGVPASLGVSHLQSQGWNHGGLDEQAVAAVGSQLTREIAEAGMAGGIYFSWIDEWFKPNWLVAQFEIPAERRALWLNRVNPEQQFGILAMDAVPAIPGATPGERHEAWQTATQLYGSPDGFRLRAAADAAYLWVALESSTGPLPEDLLLGFDTIDSLRGDRAWPSPGPTGPVPVGLEFVLRATFPGGGRDGTVELLADSASNPWVITEIRDYMPHGRAYRLPRVEPVPPGLFFGRWHATPNVPFRTLANSDGAYTPLRVIVNRLRYGRDSTEFLAVGYNRGILRAGPAPDGTWEATLERDLLEIRIPWMLLNFTDPSDHRVLQGADSASGAFLSERVPGIRIVGAYRTPTGWVTLPGHGQQGVSIFRWPGWERPRYRARLRPIYEALRVTFGQLRPHEAQEVP